VILVFQTDERAVNGKIEARFLSWPITSCLLVTRAQSQRASLKRLWRGHFDE